MNPNENRYFVELAYNGKNYHGWQFQPNAISVQEVLNKAFSTILRTDVNFVGAGRTDTGVHASYFVAHFDFPGRIDDCSLLLDKINRFGLDGIRVDSITQVDAGLHARFGALSRTYHYFISTARNPFLDEISWVYTRSLDIDLMNQAAEKLLKTKDFTSFARLHTDNKTNLCELETALWTKKGDFLVFEIKADRFLRNMVRAVVGTMVDVGLKKISLEQFTLIIKGHDRSLAGQSAPPQGLFLSRIDYPVDLFKGNIRPVFPL